MNNNECEDGRKTSFWSATKGVFKTVGCGINAMASAAEAAALSANKMAQEGHDAITLHLVETLKITHADGSLIEDVHIARLLSDAYSEKDFKKISAISMVYNLNVDQFLLNQARHSEIQKLIQK